MKKLLLILLMLLVPWQAYAAAGRNLAHLVEGAGQGAQAVVQHIADHDLHVAHHHGDEGDGGPAANGHDGNDSASGGKVTNGDSATAVHKDASKESRQHLVDFECGCALNLLPASQESAAVPWGEHVLSGISTDAYFDRTVAPLRRPPRAAR